MLSRSLVINFVEKRIKNSKYLKIIAGKLIARLSINKII